MPWIRSTGWRLSWCQPRWSQPLRLPLLSLASQGQGAFSTVWRAMHRTSGQVLVGAGWYMWRNQTWNWRTFRFVGRFLLWGWCFFGNDDWLFGDFWLYCDAVEHPEQTAAWLNPQRNVWRPINGRNKRKNNFKKTCHCLFYPKLYGIFHWKPGFCSVFVCSFCLFNIFIHSERPEVVPWHGDRSGPSRRSTPQTCHPPKLLMRPGWRPLQISKFWAFFGGELKTCWICVLVTHIMRYLP